MERLSIFDIFKIGIGPSSSHTMGPWKAALDFIKDLEEKEATKIEINLYGSLSKTGRGHATDIAIQMGLEGYNPRTCDPSEIMNIINQIKHQGTININDKSLIFNPLEDIKFRPRKDSRHPNTLIFKAFFKKKVIRENCYFSVGGGFIEKLGSPDISRDKMDLPYPIESGADILKYIDELNCNLSDIVFKNEQAFRTETEIENELILIFDTMINCVYQGCIHDGILPGGLNVKRRARKICKQLLSDKEFQSLDEWKRIVHEAEENFRTITTWVSCFALAVNEENASMGRIVTSPTNGAAGVIPAVLLYHYFFSEHKGMADVKRFLFVAGEIGCLFKKRATISAAVGGCQAEIGVSSSMAAAGLTEIMGGTPRQVLMAAEIAMEHHLGMTCDPVGGLVQIPCIERNTMGAMKAITACKLALSSDPEDAVVNLDLVIKTMWDTAQAMNHKYKETSEGGLAFNLPVAFPSC